MTKHKQSQIAKIDDIEASYKDVRDFIDWLMSHPALVLAEWSKTTDEGKERFNPVLMPASIDTTALLHQYFDIDTAALESERRDLIESLRRLGHPDY